LAIARQGAERGALLVLEESIAGVLKGGDGAAGEGGTSCDGGHGGRDGGEVYGRHGGGGGEEERMVVVVVVVVVVI